MSRDLPTTVPPGPAPAQPWNRQRLRSNNEWLLLERLRLGGPSSRAQLARDTGLSKPTVSAALAALEQAGLAREAGRFVPERGRTAVLYEPDPLAGHVLGVDIGRARLRVAVADLAGDIVARRDIPNKGRTANAVADAVVAAARETTAEAGIAAAGIVHAVIATPGVWDEERRGVRYATSLPGWGRSGLFDRIAAGLETTITVGNDANLAALGEYTLGAGRGAAAGCSPTWWPGRASASGWSRTASRCSAPTARSARWAWSRSRRTPTAPRAAPSSRSPRRRRSSGLRWTSA